MQCISGSRLCAAQAIHVVFQVVTLKHQVSAARRWQASSLEKETVREQASRATKLLVDGVDVNHQSRIIEATVDTSWLIGDARLMDLFL